MKINDDDTYFCLTAWADLFTIRKYDLGKIEKFFHSFLHSFIRRTALTIYQFNLKFIMAGLILWYWLIRLRYKYPDITQVLSGRAETRHCRRNRLTIYSGFPPPGWLTSTKSVDCQILFVIACSHQVKDLQKCSHLCPLSIV